MKSIGVPLFCSPLFCARNIVWLKMMNLYRKLWSLSFLWVLMVFKVNLIYFCLCFSFLICLSIQGFEFTFRSQAQLFSTILSTGINGHKLHLDILLKAYTNVRNANHLRTMRISDLLLHIFSLCTTLKVVIINDFQSCMLDSAGCWGSSAG